MHKAESLRYTKSYRKVIELSYIKESLDPEVRPVMQANCLWQKVNPFQKQEWLRGMSWRGAIIQRRVRYASPRRHTSHMRSVIEEAV